MPGFLWLLLLWLSMLIFFYEHPALNKITVDGFFRIAVPFFLMINGYYFHENISHVESFKKWLKRGIVLFFVWQAIYLPLYLPIEDLSGFVE